ncbi:IMP 5'-nucleotidase [Recurvomyces mirabilis]|uniref:IMP-specific 5'-nucleotidase 1 n=1 Tax=Recurvomyces mirabilis TaxID=574656 RepID=A0AAE0WWR5_9PEZI|nr:IMP 5'-nucleotidase [Recurvomyces mirabilis]KAK5158901.1 IMP 5'-nucleotidase [Recurvomyces mirabilis]
MASNALNRYCQIMQDIEELVNDHILQSRNEQGSISKLKLLVPSVGLFFTPLPLQDAFRYQDAQRRISSRRFVAPSFNDIRLVLNTAQVMSLVRNSRLELVTFDGDVTLYDDGEVLKPEDPCIERIITMMRIGTRIGLVTAAGYTEAKEYHRRFAGLLDAIAASDHSHKLEHKLVVMGGESNFMFTYTPTAPYKLEQVPDADWRLPEMETWTHENVNALLDVAEQALRDCIKTLAIPVSVLRKSHAVGIYPEKGTRLSREILEETVLNVRQLISASLAGQRIPFCAFNGGNDVFVDIGDKSYGVMACQRYFGGIEAAKTLHVGDQFLSAGANDFKARLACCTAWIASPKETVQLLDEVVELGGHTP